MTEATNDVTQSPIIETQTPAEKTFTQNEVNEIVGRTRHEATERVKRQVENQQKAPDESKPYQAMNSGDVGEDRYRKIAAEEAQRLRDQWISDAQVKSETDHAQKIVQNFWDKVSPGKTKYEDFEKVTGDIEYARFPNVVQLLAEHLDNSADVLYELGKNRMKMAQLEQLSYMSPKDAIVEAKRLSESIKANESTTKVRTPNSPLSQQRSSGTGVDSGGVLSVSDYRKKYRV